MQGLPILPYFLLSLSPDKGPAGRPRRRLCTWTAGTDGDLSPRFPVSGFRWFLLEQTGQVAALVSGLLSRRIHDNLVWATVFVEKKRMWSEGFGRFLFRSQDL